MINELERIWKETIVSEFTVLSRHFTGGTEENHEKPVRKSCLRAKI
jgi:hypothetical protein